MGHGRALINVEESEKQLEIYEKIIARSLSVRDTELLVQKSKKSQSTGTTKALKPLFYDDAAGELKSYFNTSVTIKVNQKGKGNIQIQFDSQEDLNYIIKKIKSED
jgi:ParB family chromosome partitioning protein